MLPFISPLPSFLSEDNGVVTSGYPVHASSSSYSSSVPSAVASHSIPMPSGTTSGDLVILLISGLGDFGFPLTMPTPSGWTQLYYYKQPGGETHYKAIWRVVTGSSNLSYNTGNASVLTAVGLRFTDHSSDVKVNYSSGSSGTSINPPSLTIGGVADSWGNTPHALWFAIGHAGTGLTGTPSGFSDAVTVSSSGWVSIRRSSRSEQVDTLDPSAYTGSTSGVRLAATIAIRGALV